MPAWLASAVPDLIKSGPIGFLCILQILIYLEIAQLNQSVGYLMGQNNSVPVQVIQHPATAAQTEE